MKFRLADAPLIVKLGIAPVVALVMLAVLSTGMIISQSSQTAALQSVVEVDMSNSLALERISRRISAANGELYTLISHQAGKIDVDKIPDRLTKLSKDLGEISSDLAVAEKKAPAGERASYEAVQKELKDYRDGVDIVGSMLAVDFGTAAGFLAPFESHYRSMSATLDTLVANVRRQTDARAAASTASARAAGLIAILATLGTLLVVGAVALFSVLNVRQAIDRIAAATGRLARGDNAIDLDGMARKDELGAIVDALKVFRDAAFEKARLQSETEESRRAVREEREQNERQQAEAASRQTAVVESLAQGLERLSNGDLTVDLSTPFAPEYEQLRKDFNKAVHQLREAIGAVVTSVTSIEGSSDEIRNAADDLARRSEQQAATLEQTAAAVEQITATVGKSADAADTARVSVVATRKEVEASEALMGDAVQAMDQIDQSARQISQIIGVIDEIAFQTNLLALNAGVEAARAGDAGRGFAVVASEVRALAQRSADAAREIKSLILTSTGQVAHGVELVGRTGVALKSAVKRAGEIASLVDAIAHSSREQATALHEVNSAVVQMDRVTQENAAMVEETAAASHALANDSAELTRLVARFDVGERPEATVRRPAQTLAPSLARPGAARSRASAGKAATQKAVGQDWAEF